MCRPCFQTIKVMIFNKSTILWNVTGATTLLLLKLVVIPCENGNRKDQTCNTVTEAHVTSYHFRKALLLKKIAIVGYCVSSSVVAEVTSQKSNRERRTNYGKEDQH